MSRESMVVSFLIMLYGLWVLLPLVPSVLIYWLFPDTKIAASGPLANLTVKTSGAFAGYLIVFLVTFPLIKSIKDEIIGFEQQVWTMSGTVQLVDADGKEIHSQSLLNKIGVEVEPNPFLHKSYFVKLRVMQGDDGSYPYVSIKIPDFGEQDVDLNTISPSDNYRKIFDLGTISIRQDKDIKSDAAIAQESRVDEGAHNTRSPPN